MSRLHPTLSIVLTTQPYRETSVITRFLTEAFGLQSYLLKGIRSAKGRHQAALLQPLTVLDTVVYHKSGGGLQFVREMQSYIPPCMLESQPEKAAVVLFFTEVLQRLLPEEGAQPALFTAALQLIHDLQCPPPKWGPWILHHLLRLGTGQGVGLTADWVHAFSDMHLVPTEADAAQLLALYQASPLSLPQSEVRRLLQLVLALLEKHAGLRLPLRSLPVLQSVFQ